jgi:hypothetical protein
VEAGEPEMQDQSKPTEIEKLGPKFKDIIARSLVAVAVATSVIGGVGQVIDFVQTEKAETAQLIKDARGTDQLSAHIIKKSGDQKATDFLILKSALQEEKNAIDDTIKNANALSKMLGLQENREFRSSQYQYMLDDVQHRLNELEANGQKPFDHLKDRNNPARVKTASSDLTEEPNGLTL